MLALLSNNQRAKFFFKQINLKNIFILDVKNMIQIVMYQIIMMLFYFYIFPDNFLQLGQ